jgi:hypothetical protein
MSREIKSAVLGTLKQDTQLSDWWKSEAVEIPYFNNQKLAITFIDFEPDEDKAFVTEADQALAHFLQLTLDDRNAISSHVLKNCLEFLDAVEMDEQDDYLREIVDENEIWNFVEPSEIFISRRNRRDRDIYVQIDCNCEWEQEHGLQLVFRQGKKLTRISGIDGHLTESDAYDKSDEQDELLSKF